MSDTIFALATPPGRSGVAIIRVSGPDAVSVCSRLCSVPEPAQFRLASIRTADGRLIDRALVLRFAVGASFTGEDVVEFQCHGSLSVIDKLTHALRQIGCRDADAGEFTRRALENNAMSLVEVEGLADLIDAETDAQHAQAISAFSGSLRGEIESWGERLRNSIALLEATIDFADEDVPVDVRPEVKNDLYAMTNEISDLLARSEISNKVRDGFKVAILGAPNTGKSTLLNRIAGAEVAITSNIAGTTRDIVTARLDLGGFLVELADTAGLRDTDDTVEAIGVERALSYAEKADVRVYLMVGDKDDFAIPPRPVDIVLTAKCDDGADETGISGKTGFGVDRLLDTLRSRLRTTDVQDTVLIRDRQRSGVTTALTHLTSALETLNSEAAEEVVIHDLYVARRSLDFVIGRLGVEDILDDIFSSFCIGK